MRCLKHLETNLEGRERKDAARFGEGEHGLRCLEGSEQTGRGIQTSSLTLVGEGADL